MKVYGDIFKDEPDFYLQQTRPKISPSIATEEKSGETRLTLTSSLLLSRTTARGYLFREKLNLPSSLLLRAGSIRLMYEEALRVFVTGNRFIIEEKYLQCLCFNLVPWLPETRREVKRRRSKESGASFSGKGSLTPWIEV
jgi:hypothetical protein